MALTMQPATAYTLLRRQLGAAATLNEDVADLLAQFVDALHLPDAQASIRACIDSLNQGARLHRTMLDTTRTWPE